MTVPGNFRRSFRGLLATALAAALAIAFPCASRAQGQLWAAWLACAPNGVANLVPTCDYNTIDRSLYLSFMPDQDIPDVVGWSLVVDVVSDASPLPPWWQLQPGGCRSGQLATGIPDAADGNCEDVWSATGSALIQSLIYPRPGGDASQLRIIVGVGLPAGQTVTLQAGHPYLAAILDLRFAMTAPPGECAGCSVPACLVFNSAEIQRQPGAPGGPVPPLATPGSGTGNQVTWGSGTSCAAVPTVPTTWGRLKSLYR